MNMKTKIVNFTLIENIAIIVKIIFNGSLTINSKIDNIEFCTSLTSPAILEIVSPLRFSEKKAYGNSMVFLYIASRMSRRMPLRKNVMKNIAK